MSESIVGLCGSRMEKEAIRRWRENTLNGKGEVGGTSPGRKGGPLKVRKGAGRDGEGTLRSSQSYHRRHQAAAGAASFFSALSVFSVAGFVSLASDLLSAESALVPLLP